MSPRRVHLLIAFLPCALAFVGLLAFFAHDPLWPAQDMTPQMAADYHRAQEQAAFAYQMATGLFALGLLWSVGCLWWHSRAKRPTASIRTA